MGLLYDPITQTIATLKPVNYVSLATPHLGTRSGIGWFTENVFGWLPFLRGTTDQFYLRDAPPDWRNRPIQITRTAEEAFENLKKQQIGVLGKRHVPLLWEMSMEGSVWFCAFAAFQQRLLYANVEDDYRVTFQSGAIWPFLMVGDVWKRPFLYMDKYPSVVNHPVADFTWTISTDIRDPTVIINSKQMRLYYPITSEEWEMAYHLNKIPHTRISCHFTGWFGRFLNHGNISVGFESLNKEGKNVIDHFVQHFKPTA
eukprot:TRINITY_DN796_c0_g1_i2.p1 TRINITY_DN796_c0_g1~~TRINITY_DN796_c0_g1_i2.p1  ORF type:complete len:257 (+),score=45.39 TRINITY_DN796_c0_g1_i2:391-1161(+)